MRLRQSFEPLVEVRRPLDEVGTAAWTPKVGNATEGHAGPDPSNTSLEVAVLSNHMFALRRSFESLFRSGTEGARLGDSSATDTQIGCYLSPEEAEQLDEYARGLELSRPKLCILLVGRELRCNRLGTLRDNAYSTIGKSTGVRVTTRPIHAHVKTAFTEHVGSVGLGSDEAAAIVFRAELDERWLEWAMSPEGNRP